MEMKVQPFVAELERLGARRARILLRMKCAVERHMGRLHPALQKKAASSVHGF